MSKPKEFSPSAAIQAILDKFLKPMLRFRPKGMTTQEFLEDIVFQLKTRDITTYIAKKDFNLLGELMVQAKKPIPGIGSRRVREGDILVVRYDRKEGHQREVEIYSGPGKKQHVYRVHNDEWPYVERFIVNRDGLRLSKKGTKSAIKHNTRRLRMAGLSKKTSKRLAEELCYEE